MKKPVSLNYPRRTFLKTATAGMGALVALPETAAARSAAARTSLGGLAEFDAPREARVLPCREITIEYGFEFLDFRPESFIKPAQCFCRQLRERRTPAEEQPFQG
jgi:hypothetical protein